MISLKPERTEQDVLFDFSKPALHVLSYALRHPETWPKGFVWDYSDCDQCAAGLAHQLWEFSVPVVDIDDITSKMARSFAMPYEDAHKIFMFANYRQEPWLFGLLKKDVHLDAKTVTPEMVADDIDAYLKRAE